MERSKSVMCEESLILNPMFGGERGGAEGLGRMNKSLLLRSKSLKFRRAFDAKELLGIDPSEIREGEHIELPTEDQVLGDPCEGRSEQMQCVPINGVSVSEEQVGSGEHKVIAFSTGGTDAEEKDETLFVLPVVQKVEEVYDSSDEGDSFYSDDDDDDDDDAPGRMEETDEIHPLETSYVEGDEDGDKNNSVEREAVRTESPSRSVEGGGASVPDTNSGDQEALGGRHIQLGPIENVSEVHLDMEEVELDEGPVEDQETEEPRARGRERVRFAPAIADEERSARSRIRGILKTGRSASATPFSRIRFSMHEDGVDEEQAAQEFMEGSSTGGSGRMNSRGNSGSSGQFFLNAEGNLESSDFPRQKSYGFAGMVQIHPSVPNAEDFSGGRSGRNHDRRTGPTRRRARSVAVLPRNPSANDPIPDDDC